MSLRTGRFNLCYRAKIQAQKRFDFMEQTVEEAFKNEDKKKGTGRLFRFLRYHLKWHPHRDSNPGYQDENLMS